MQGIDVCRLQATKIQWNSQVDMAHPKKTLQLKVQVGQHHTTSRDMQQKWLSEQNN